MQTPTVALQTLEIRTFGEVEPVVLHFNRGVNVFMGRNGSGKATLLQLISCVVRADFDEVASVDFDVTWTLLVNYGGEEVLVTATARSMPSKSAGVCGLSGIDTLLSASQRDVLFEVKASHKGQSNHYCCHNGQVSFVSDSDLDSTPTMLLMPATPVGGLVLLFLCKSVEQISGIGEPAFLSQFLVLRSSERLYEGLGAYRSLTQPGESPFHGTFSEQKGLSLYFGASAFHSSKYTASADHRLRFSSEEGSVPARIAKNMGLQGALHFECSPTSWDESRGVKTLRYTHFDIGLEENGRFRDSRTFSYGQKRALAFFYLVAGPSPIFIADELVNGLHHSMIQAAVGELSKKQSFLSSQNPLLLDHLEFEDRSCLQRAFFVCSEEKGRWQWRGLTEGEARPMWESYEVNSLHLSEILRNHGLW